MNSANPLFTSTSIREIEQAAMLMHAEGELMRKAGHAAARAAMRILAAVPGEKNVLIAAGPGNNGGDAYIVAAELHRVAIKVVVLCMADPDSLPADAQAAYRSARAASVPMADVSALPSLMHQRFDLIIDGLFGIGLGRAIESHYRTVVDWINGSGFTVLALDLPSGLNADTGDLIGGGPAIRASRTITFIGDKPGLRTAFGRDHAGVVEVASLDLPHALFPNSDGSLICPSHFAAFIKRRMHNSHKGSYGNVAVIGGAAGMHGAVVLAGASALKAGAGRVYLGFMADPPAYDPVQPELMCRHADDLSFETHVIVAGPGMGTSVQAIKSLERAIASAQPLVADADALNLIAEREALRSAVAKRDAPTLLTPHPLEAARLLGTNAQHIQRDRIAAAKLLAKRFNAVVLLKGSGTVIARPDGRYAINPTGNPGLASAGTGDVLAGLCGALLAQSCPAWQAAMAAVWIHGRAADVLVEEGIGPIGLSASELIGPIRTILNNLSEGRF